MFNYDGTATFTHNGLTFTARQIDDDSMGAPWEEHDGHGPVSDWVRRDKRPGERLLVQDGRSSRFYDIEEATRIAKADGWDAEPIGTGTKGEQAARAVEADFQRLRRWCNDQWHWVGIVVCHEESGLEASLWGIESDSGAYLEEVARDLADEIADQMPEQEEEQLVDAITLVRGAGYDVVRTSPE